MARAPLIAAQLCRHGEQPGGCPDPAEPQRRLLACCELGPGDWSIAAAGTDDVISLLWHNGVCRASGGKNGIDIDGVAATKPDSGS